MTDYVMRGQDGSEIPAERQADGSYTFSVPAGVTTVRGPFPAGSKEWSWPVPPGVTRATAEFLPGVTWTEPPELGPCGWPMIDADGCVACPECGHRHLRIIEVWGGGGSG